MMGALLTHLQSCGPRALRRAARAQGLNPGLPELRRLAGTTAQGTSIAGLARAARALGFEAVAARCDFAGAMATGAPFIAHLRGDHFVLVDRCAPSRVRLSGTWPGTISREAFEQQWSGFLLTLHPTATPGVRHG